MSESFSKTSKRALNPLRTIAFVLLAASMACSLPGLIRRSTPTPEAAPTFTPAPPTPTPLPLPPAIVESNPPAGAEVPLDGAITLYFNQPMDRLSVENSLSVQPDLAGDLTWSDDTTLVFAPTQPLEPESEITFNLQSGARSARGLSLAEPLSLNFRAVGYLRLGQALPVPDTSDVDPSSAVVASFNRPVVPLGADPASQAPAFTLQPQANGHGEWLNTSTYIFYPEPPLEGGKTYSVALNPDLTGVDGSPLQDTQGWTFYTATPQLLTFLPDPGLGDVRLNAVISMTFNQPMDPLSVESSFALIGADGGAVDGAAIWTEDNTGFTYKPNDLLRRGEVYSVVLNGEALASGGTALGQGFETTLRAVPPLGVAYSDPSPNSIKPAYSGINLYMNSSVLDRKILDHVRIDPVVPNFGVWWNDYDRALSFYGEFAPDTNYTLTVLPTLQDPWGGTMAEEYTLEFYSAPLPSDIFLTYGSDVLFLTPQDNTLTARVTNLDETYIALGSVPWSDFIAMVSGPNGYEIRQSYQSFDEQSWFQSLDLEPNRNQPVDLFVSPDEEPLQNGIYYLRFLETGKITAEGRNFYAGPYLIAVGDAQLTFKLSATQALVWAVSLDDKTPIQNAPVTIYNEKGEAVAQGQTDANGVFTSEIPRMEDPYTTYYALLGQPGEAGFGLALSTWSQGISSWDFGLPTDFRGPHLQAYLYTERPIYRPGQTVYFRGIVRQAANGRYNLPDIGSMQLVLYKNYSEEIYSFDLPLSAFGTLHGEFILPEDAPPGDYRLASPEVGLEDIGVYFKVAEYRKPEINLQVSMAADQIRLGDSLVAQINARYFFDAPAGNLPVQWLLYSTPDYFYVPGYETGVQDPGWLTSFFNQRMFFDPLGGLVKQGEGSTDPQGLLTLEMPTENTPVRTRYTLEVTATDESGLPVSARASLIANPADFYIGLRPDQWVGQAETSMGFDTQLFNWAGQPEGRRTLRAEFQKVTWIEDEPPPNQPFFEKTFTPQYTPVSSTDFQTDGEGKARLAFTPPEAGNYLLSVSGEEARSELYLWVGGAGARIWPNLPNQRLRLVADRTDYQPGDTARIFIPNPMSGNSLALVTVERGIVMRHEIHTLAEGGSTLNFPLSTEDAPNVYISVTLIGNSESGGPDFRQGYINLQVAPTERILQVDITSQPERLGPGEEVSFEVQVSDSNGQPVQGEFSLSVVDKAVLALADPNVVDIASFFYGDQSLGVRTGVTLAAYARRDSFMVGGGGGGGGDGLIPSVVRERFPDTAYWNAELVTGADGRAQVNLALPDSLTTWQVLVRGVGEDTRVGQAEGEVIVTKELLVRPVTPRFVVAHDHVQLAAVVQNNTAQALQTEVSLQASGFTLDDPGSATQTVNVPANGRVRLEWWGSVQESESVDLVFAASASSGGTLYEDAARPASGALPVLHYIAPETFATAGVMDEGGERLELVSLPRSFDTPGGELHVELSSSLGGSMLMALDALENSTYMSTEMLLSRFLPNLEAYRAMQQLNVESPDLQRRLERTLLDGIGRLLSRQRPDGGWNWWGEEVSDPYVTAYVLYGLSRAREAGARINDLTIQRAVDFLLASLYTPDMAAEGWQLDRLAFVQFALANAGSGDLGGAEALYQQRERLSPWGKALLALTLRRMDPQIPEVDTLISDLQSTALRTATGAHWEELEPGYQNMSSPLLTTAIVVFVLAQEQPDSPVIPEAVRYMMAHRRANGSWNSTYITAWSLMALTEVMRSSGELGGSFAFSARLNGIPIATGQASGEGAPVVADIPIGDLYVDDPNALNITRSAGSGRLYYSAALKVFRAVEDVAPLQRGVSIQRTYYPLGDDCPENGCLPVESIRLGELLKVRVTVTVQEAAYYLLVEDFFPAGTEVLDTSLKTSQLGQLEGEEPVTYFDPRRPYEDGWGWWYFTAPRIYDDHISWATAYLPPGTYELTYLLVTTQAGEYRVIPARAWMFYFPEMQGHSGGAIFNIMP